MALTVEDRLELLELQHRYGHAIDGRWELFDDVFSTDGEFDPTAVGLPLTVGIEAIRSQLLALAEGKTQNHIATNAVIVEVRSDTEVVMASKYLVGGEGEFLSFGVYDDVCVKTDAGWRLASRRLRRVYSFQGVGSVQNAPLVGPGSVEAS